MTQAADIRALLDGSPIALAIIGGEGRVLYVNARHEAMYGRGPGTPRAAGGDVRDFYVNPDDRQRLAAIYRETGVLRDAEVHLKRPDGHEFWALLTWQETVWEGEPARVSWLYDITALKAAEAAAEHARALAEEANRAKSDFLANMSHELRTPLNAIIGYAQILAEDAEGQAAVLADLGKIEAAGKHLLGLINSILDLSKVEAGRVELYLESIDLAALAAEVADMVRPLAAANGNRLEVMLPEGIGRLRSDHVKLKQSLLNLLSNACKFTRDGVVGLALERADGAVRFTVSDTGIGMSEAQVARLWQPFAQADASTTRQFGGTGLGLVLTRSFVELLGGTITLDTAPGQGSRFTISLPDAAPALSTRRARGLPQADAPLILLVDDDEDAHDLLGTMLAREGFRVEHARNGTEALARARKDLPAAILLDVMMPRQDGWTVLAALKAEGPPLGHVPVVMVSMLDEKPLGMALGAADYLTKPVDRGRLAAAVRAQVQAGRGALVVEDNARERGAMLAALAEAGVAARGVADAAAALADIETHGPPGVLVLDLMLPGMDGFSLLEALRRAEKLRHTALLVVTAKALTAAERDFLTGGGGLVIAKGPGFEAALLAALPGYGA